jgi:hypothetical protein
VWVDELHGRYPRRDPRRHLLEIWKVESRGAPNGRVRWMGRYGSFAMLLRLAPFDE